VGLCYLIEYEASGCPGTDTKAYVASDTLLSRFVQGADLLIHDAEYTDAEYTGRRAPQSWGHSTGGWQSPCRGPSVKSVGADTSQRPAR